MENEREMGEWRMRERWGVENEREMGEWRMRERWGSGE